MFPSFPIDDNRTCELRSQGLGRADLLGYDPVETVLALPLKLRPVELAAAALDHRAERERRTTVIPDHAFKRRHNNQGHAGNGADPKRGGEPDAQPGKRSGSDRDDKTVQLS